LRDLRVLVVAAVVVLSASIVLGTKWIGTRRECARTERSVADVQAETRELTTLLEEERLRRAELPPHLRGHGPGGIRADVEDLFFDGPTAARSALSLTLEAHGAGFDHWRYESDDVLVPDRFPPDTGEMEDESGGAGGLPVRSRVDLTQWPLTFQLETDWDSVVDLLARLEESRPAFGVERLSVEPHRDSAGRLTDRLAVKGEIHTYWFREEE
jgi:hypothetical protein